MLMGKSKDGVLDLDVHNGLPNGHATAFERVVSIGIRQGDFAKKNGSEHYSLFSYGDRCHFSSEFGKINHFVFTFLRASERGFGGSAIDSILKSPLESCEPPRSSMFTSYPLAYCPLIGYQMARTSGQRST